MNLSKLIKYANQVIDNADDAGCSDDLIVTSKSAIERLTKEVRNIEKVVFISTEVEE